MRIDTSYDVRTDATGPDPDSSSKMLQQYHQLLWSKPLPNSKMFDLQIEAQGVLSHQSGLGSFRLRSDAFAQTFSRWQRYKHMAPLMPQDQLLNFFNLGYTIGGMIIYPCNKIDGKMTINGARGFNTKIGDRIDLTLECIRLFYQQQDNPLYQTLALYEDFFNLFGDFQGYVDFFLMQDLVDSDYASIRFFNNLIPFTDPPLPGTTGSYIEYMTNSVSFLQARNRRINEWQDQQNW